MNIALRQALTVDDYLAWSETQAEAKRTELINGQIVYMSPELVAHNRIKGAVYIALRRAIAALSIEAEVFTDGITIPIEPHTAYEPDASVRLGPRLPARDMRVPDPVIVVEVLSLTSVHMDTSAKLIGYFKLPSMKHYLVPDPESRTVTHHARGSEDRIFADALVGRVAPRPAWDHCCNRGPVWLSGAAAPSRAVVAPGHVGACPGEAAAEGREHHAVALLQP